MNKVEDAKLIEILPHNFHDDPNVLAICDALDVQITKLVDTIQSQPIFSRMDKLDNETCDRLAWEWSVEFYDPNFPITQKRELIANAIQWHRRKGTAGAVAEIVRTMFGDGRVEQWWEYGGLPHHFRVVTSNTSTTTERAREFVQAIESVKRLSSKLDNVIITQSVDYEEYTVFTVHVGEVIEI